MEKLLGNKADYICANCGNPIVRGQEPIYIYARENVGETYCHYCITDEIASKHFYENDLPNNGKIREFFENQPWLERWLEEYGQFYIGIFHGVAPEWIAEYCNETYDVIKGD